MASGMSTGAFRPGIKAVVITTSAFATSSVSIACIPRLLSRGQAFDALSSQANLAGFRAVIEAAHAYGRTMAGSMTAAGKLAPARVLVLGAGVAGLAAIQTAKNMGAVVLGYDVRPVVKEQVESMGGQFLKVRSRRPVVWRRLHAVDATRFQE